MSVATLFATDYPRNIKIMQGSLGPPIGLLILLLLRRLVGHLFQGSSDRSKAEGLRGKFDKYKDHEGIGTIGTRTKKM